MDESEGVLIEAVVYETVARLMYFYFCLFDTVIELHAMDENYLIETESGIGT